MSSNNQALETQLNNIEAKTGRDRNALMAAIMTAGLVKHGEMVAWTRETFGLGHGDANTLVHLARRSVSPPQPEDHNPLDDIYSAKKAALRPIHETLMTAINGFGEFEIAPKKGYVSLRRKRQFAMLGPKTNTRFELGLNLKEEADHPC